MPQGSYPRNGHTGITVPDYNGYQYGDDSPDGTDIQKYSLDEYQVVDPKDIYHEPPRPTAAGGGEKTSSISQRIALREWILELFALLWSLACLVATIIVLEYISDKALADWKFPIKPNTMVSIFSTLAKACLMITVISCVGQLKWIYFSRESHKLADYELFENATEPTGALRFLWFVNFRAKLALVGSIIGLLTLAVDPFTQQIISFPSRSAVSTLYNASFGVAQQYDSGVGLYLYAGNTGNRATTYAPQQAQSQMTGAMYGGVFNIDTTAQVACATGNCTWDPFITLGLTAACSNVTSETVLNHTYGSPTYTYILPGDVEMDFGVTTSMVDATQVTFMSTSTSTWAEDLWTDPKLVNFSALSFPLNGTRPQYDAGFNATQCVIKWCARLYHNLTVQNGVFTPGETTIYDLVGVPVPYENYTQLGNDYPGNYQFDIAQPDSASGNASFYVNPNDHSQIIDHLQVIFTSTTTDDYGLALGSSSNLSERVINITTLASYAIGHNPNSTIITGTVFTQETYMKVEWIWLSLPAGTVVLSVLFFFITLWYAKKERIPAWKTSELLPLFTKVVGPNGEDPEAKPLSPAGLEKASTGMKARFSSDGLLMMTTNTTDAT